MYCPICGHKDPIIDRKPFSHVKTEGLEETIVLCCPCGAVVHVGHVKENFKQEDFVWEKNTK